jgi:hypothetical protein
MAHNQLRDHLSVVRGRIEAHQPVLLDPGGVHRLQLAKIVWEDALHPTAFGSADWKEYDGRCAFFIAGKLHAGF